MFVQSIPLFSINGSIPAREVAAGRSRHNSPADVPCIGMATAEAQNRIRTEAARRIHSLIARGKADSRLEEGGSLLEWGSLPAAAEGDTNLLGDKARWEKADRFGSRTGLLAHCRSVSGMLWLLNLEVGGMLGLRDKAGG